MKQKIKIILFVFVSCLLINITVYSKYVFDKTLDVAQVNLDRTKPVLSVIEIKNSNIGYEKYANKNQTITLKVQVNEKNIRTDEIKTDEICVLVGNIEIVPSSINVSKQSTNGNITMYQISITGITGNGKLQIRFKEGVFTDIAGWKNLEYIADTNIMIDNIAPQATFSELAFPYDESEGTLIVNEQVRPIENWKIDETGKIFKSMFRKNGTYVYTIVDYAGNLTQVSIQIKKAEHLSFEI